MKRILALLTACMCLAVCIPSAMAAEEYTMAEKLLKQLWAGSGFSGTLTIEAEGESFSTAKPITIEADYIYVRPDTDGAGEHRADFTLTDGENALSTAHVQMLDGQTRFQADVLGEKCFAVDLPQEDAEETVNQMLSHTGMPQAAETALMLLAAAETAPGLDSLTDSYATRLDIWIEGFRQNAILDKLEDGTTTMEVNYAVSPAAIKAQVKQLVLDLMNDQAARDSLASVLQEETAALYLNPELLSWYFDAVDALPLAGDLTISRTVSFKGDTMELFLSLPLYDAQGGETTIVYIRQQGQGDLPDSHTLRLESALRVAEIVCQAYTSMTGVTVLQGTFVSEPATFSVGDDVADPVAAAFTFKHETAESTDEQGREVYGIRTSLNLSPIEEDSFEAFECSLDMSFASKELKSAATEMTASAEWTSGESAVRLNFLGQSRKKWEPEALPQETLSLSDLDENALAAAGLELFGLLKDTITLPNP